jgi:hypothetical protein
MTPQTTILAGLEIISSWLISSLVIFAAMLAVILSLAFFEFVVERGAVERAYTVKCNSSDHGVASPGHRNKP